MCIICSSFLLESLYSSPACFLYNENLSKLCIEVDYSHCGFSPPTLQQLQEQQSQGQKRQKMINLILLKNKQYTESTLQQCDDILSSETVVLKTKQREESRRIHILPLFPIDILYKIFG